jgi:oligopeptide transport system substrate-binding protein
MPEVAKSWDVSEGGGRYVFHLRDDVYWSDGRPVTAEDFVYASRRILHPAVQSPSAGLLFDIKGAEAFNRGEISDPDKLGVRAINPETLLVETEGPTGCLPQLLAQVSFFPLPRHVVERFGSAWTDAANIVTNGPFKLEHYQPGQIIVLTRNPRYRGPTTGNVQRVELYLNITSPADRLAMYETDQLDVVSLHYYYSDVDRIRQQHASEYFSGPMVYVQYLGFNVTRPPFDDRRVRRAFAMAIDKEALASTLLRGYHFPANGGFIPPTVFGHSPEIGLPYNPESARQLLAEAGYPDGRDFPVIEYLAKYTYQTEFEFFARQWRKNLGIEIEWQTMEWGALLNRLDQNPPHLFRMGWGTDYPDPDNLLRVSSHIRMTRWQNETYASLVEEARRISDHAERIKRYRAADKILMEEAVVVPILYGCKHLLIKPWITKYPTSPVDTNFWKDVVIEPH